MKHSITREPTLCSSSLLAKYQFYPAACVDTREPLSNIIHIEMTQKRIMQVGCIKMGVMEKDKKKLSRKHIKEANREPQN